MRILVTGASGFIGAHLVRRLDAGGHEVFVLPSPRFRAGRLAGVRYGVVERAGDARADLVYHLAGTPIEASDAEHERVVLGGMQRLLEQLHGHEPRRLVVTGSAAEYGSGHDWREEDEPRPDTAFGKMKRAAGEMARASGIATVRLRLFTPYGEGEGERRLVPSTIRAALAGQPVRLRSNGRQTRDYFHVSDLVDALVEAGRRPLEPGIAINLCSGTARAVLDVARRIVELCGGRSPVEPGAGEPAAMAHSSGNPERARRLLGWRPKIDFEKGLHMTLTLEEHSVLKAGATPGQSCLACGAAAPVPFLDLGHTALANNLPAGPDDWQPEFPLRVGFCEGCHHVQLLDIVPPEAMFTEYLYMSSASSTLAAHFVELASAAHARAGLSPATLAVDIGSNDGSLLAALAALGTRTRGVDPAANLAALALERGIETEVAYFNPETAARLREQYGRAQLITATNSFPHIPCLDGYLDGVAALLEPGGMFVVEAHYLGDLVEQNAFDTIYHEHVSYWALGPLERLVARHGLEVFDVERLPIHHGQLRAWIGLSGRHAVAPSVAQLRAEEERAGLTRLDTFIDLARRVDALRCSIPAEIRRLREEGLQVAGYGAPAKASTLLASCGLGPQDIAWIADRNQLKQGRFTPGTRIPIAGPERIAAERPDVLVLFAWNFAAEVMAQLEDFRRAGGRFLIPVPQVRLV